MSLSYQYKSVGTPVALNCKLLDCNYAHFKISIFRGFEAYKNKADENRSVLEIGH